jgi:hypothetical protein
LSEGRRVMEEIKIPAVPDSPTEGAIIEAKGIIKSIEEGDTSFKNLTTEAKRDFKYAQAVMRKARTAKKAYGGYVKKYANGGGVRKVRV